MPKLYFEREDLEKKLKNLLNKSNLVIVYGPKHSGLLFLITLGKSITIWKVLENSTFQNIKLIFESFKEKYGKYPIINVEINEEYDLSMEEWVRDGRALTEDGKGVCDFIIQFSYENALLAGLVEKQRSKYIRFNDLSEEEAIKFLTFNNIKENQKKIIEEMKTTRIGALEKVVRGKGHLFERFIQSYDLYLQKL